ncbi:beta-1,4-glucuronyltransferase 1 [Protopterus annectens]|uniref:beta-1,4-glucuronyltransferase 1 n=1 Tax=Protopterus annectens TaxID=7888 RepID=UPI001CFA52E4|nr:beta-1,4-glucuronyltransferase 1 [Protopterus annectens]
MPVKCSLFKVVLIALFLVALLQFIYLSLLSKLHGRLQNYRYSELFQTGNFKRDNLQREKNDRKEHFRYSLSSGGVLDVSGQYRIYSSILQSEAIARRGELRGDFALATHTSINNLHQLKDLVDRWQNQISLSLFAIANDVRFATMIIFALSSFCSEVQELVTFHLVCHSGDLAVFPEQDHNAFAKLRNCASVFKKLHAYRAKYQNYAIGNNASYPNNLLRNVARTGTNSKYLMTIDIDMLPSEKLHSEFLNLIEENVDIEEQTLFVVPAFEIRHTRRIPSTKSELLQLYQVGEVRAFYEELCWKCHAPTNYSRWINLSVDSKLAEAYAVEWRDPWEPFYVSVNSVPLFDERFKQYGFNRISQACELHVAGYQFLVLNNAFLIHKGFKTASEFHAGKDAENRRNKIIFRQFKQDLKNKYPESPRRC